MRYGASLAGEIELKWQRVWQEQNAFVVKNPGDPGFDASKPKFYCLDMFPYPSGAGLHVGHPEGYTATDILCRYKRMNGFNVLHPMGWDAFGLPAEQYAIQTGVHPAITTKKAIENFRRQLQRFGFSYDWSREFGTIDPEYYKWTQWIFLQLYNAWFDESAQKARPIADLIQALQAGTLAAEANPKSEVDPISPAPSSWSACTKAQQRTIIDSYRLAYIGETTVNWCPKLGTVLANDEVNEGRSERGGFPVLRKPLKQWMFRITSFADRLLSQLDGLDWPESTKAMQREWIGKSEGAEIDFAVSTSSGPLGKLRVFTTRPDTLFGATYMVVAPEHELCGKILAGNMAGGKVDASTAAALKAYVEQARNRTDVERQESKKKTGVFTGVYATNPATGQPIPVWAADYVLMGYGTGAIMAVPAHDERDFEFAKAYGLPVIEVVTPPTSAKSDAGKETCFSGDGIAVNSASSELTLTGLTTRDAKAAIIAWLARTGRGERKVNYRLRDWTFSRQRYWGEPFPIVFDAEGNHYAVGESSLPVVLPELADYAPIESDDPQPLLAKAKDWVKVTAAQVGIDSATLPANTPLFRETNTMPGSAGSSWYFLRYCDAKNGKSFASNAATDYWTNVDLYLGGSEHAVGHLLYSRFWNNVLHDLGHVRTAEPFQKLFHQGLITSFAYQRSDKSLVAVDLVDEVGEPGSGKFIERENGQPVTQIVAKMSKSLKNVVNPDDVIAEFGADTFRLYEMYMGPLDASKPWNPRDIIGCFRFLQRLWRVLVDEATGALKLIDTPSADTAKTEKLLHRATAKVGADIERLAFNTGIAAMIELVNAITPPGGANTAVLTRAQAERLTLILSPFAPHMAEELWAKLHSGQSSRAMHQAWPKVDPAMLVDNEVEIPVSIAGKVRHRIVVPVAADAATLEKIAMADAKVQELVAGKPIKKMICVPGKMVNIVV
jgi:leucyl-tRNA synthetase